MKTSTKDLLLPEVILTGSEAEAGNALGRHAATFPTVDEVQAWRDHLRARGITFASHAATCQYWLYEQELPQPPKVT